MEEKRLDRRSLLKYAGVGSLTSLATLSGVARVAPAQGDEGLGLLLDFIARTPDIVINGLHEAVFHDSLEERDEREGFIANPRKWLADKGILELRKGMYAVVAINMHYKSDETPAINLELGEAPSFARIGGAAIGFFSANVGLLLMEVIRE